MAAARCHEGGGIASPFLGGAGREAVKLLAVGSGLRSCMIDAILAWLVSLLCRRLLSSANHIFIRICRSRTIVVVPNRLLPGSGVAVAR